MSGGASVPQKKRAKKGGTSRKNPGLLNPISHLITAARFRDLLIAARDKGRAVARAPSATADSQEDPFSVDDLIVRTSQQQTEKEIKDALAAVLRPNKLASDTGVQPRPEEDSRAIEVMPIVPFAGVSPLQATRITRVHDHESHLHTIGARFELWKRRQQLLKKRVVQLRNRNYLPDRDQLPPPSADEVKALEKELVLQVAVYHPNKVDTITQEFLVLGSQPLSALVHHTDWYCLSSEMGKCSQHPFSSSSLYINGVFYNDNRANTIDLSRPVREWMCRHGAPSTPPVADMHTTKFSDLSLRLGAHYLYLHQADCEHIVVFNDARLWHPSDGVAFPKQIFQCKVQRRKCMVCGATSHWVVYDDYCAAESPVFECNSCFRACHYDLEKSTSTLMYKSFRPCPYFHE